MFMIMKGLGEIDINQKESLINETYFKLIRKVDRLDSLIIANPYGKGSQTMKLQVAEGDPVSLYITNYLYHGGIDGKYYDKTYRCIQPKKSDSIHTLGWLWMAGNFH